MFRSIGQRHLRLIVLASLLVPSAALCATVQDQAAPGAAPASGQAGGNGANNTSQASAQAVQNLSAELDKVKQLLEQQRKQFLADLGAPDKWSQAVTCLFKKPLDSNGGDSPTLDCGKALVVGGEYISAVTVSGIPKSSKLTVSIAAADFWGGEGRNNPVTSLSTDSLTFNDGRDSALIQVHKDRYIRPSYGGYRSSVENARRNLRGDTPENRSTLSIVLSSSPLVALVQARFTDANGNVQTAMGPLFLVYERWAVETGGFLALTNVGDRTLKTSTGSDGKVHVDRIETSHGLNQQTGVMLGVVPRNYDFLGIGLGLATNSDRAQDIYLGVNLRARAFGNSGLASVFLGAVNRNIRVFRDVEGKDFAADSERLKGSIESNIGYAIGFSFGFKFGGIEATTTPATASGQK